MGPSIRSPSPTRMVRRNGPCESGPGHIRDHEARMPGLYRLTDGRTRLVAVGALNPLEWAEITSSAEPLSGLAKPHLAAYSDVGQCSSVRRVAPTGPRSAVTGSDSGKTVIMW